MMIFNIKKNSIKLLQSRLALARGTPGSMDRRHLEPFTMFSTLNGMSMNVSDMSPYSHYAPHYTYQVRFAVQISIPFGYLKCFIDF